MGEERSLPCLSLTPLVLSLSKHRRVRMGQERSLPCLSLTPLVLSLSKYGADRAQPMQDQPMPKDEYG